MAGKAYNGFNGPSGRPGKMAGGSRNVMSGKKTVSHSNEQPMPGQNAAAMAPMGTNRRVGSSAATNTINGNMKDRGP